MKNKVKKYRLNTESAQRAIMMVVRNLGSASNSYGHLIEEYVVAVISETHVKTGAARYVRQGTSAEERRKIDVVIGGIFGERYDLQVKCSEKAALLFKRDHPHKAVVAVTLEDSPVRVAAKVEKAIPVLKEARRAINGNGRCNRPI